jgi:O-antigen/teichoic acid export membrane protein
MKIKNFTDIKSLFFDNITLKQTIFKNTVWLVVAEGVTKFLKLILIIYVARILGATEYGKFTFALAFLSLFAIFSDLGVSQITIRELSQEKEKQFPAILSLKLLLSLGTLILILIGSFFITSDPVIRGVIWILAVYIIVNSFSGIISAFFQARQQMEYQALAGILQAIIITAAGFFVILNFPSIENLSYSYLFASLAALIFILILFHLKAFPLRISWQKSIWQRFLSMSWPLALAGIFGGIYSQTDSVMMGYWGQLTQTGWYNAAYKIIGAIFILVTLIATSFYPALSKFFQDSNKKLQTVWNYFMDSMIILAIPIVIGGIALAPRIIDFIYGPTYFPTGRETILAFQILLIMAGLVFFSNPFSQILIVANQQKKLFFVTLAGAVINAILNLILIPTYSLYGAAATTVATCFLIFFLLFHFTSRLTPIKPLNLKFFLNCIGAILATIPMYFLIIQPQIYHLNIFLSIPIGAGVYLICFLVYKSLVGKFSTY